MKKGVWEGNRTRTVTLWVQPKALFYTKCTGASFAVLLIVLYFVYTSSLSFWWIIPPLLVLLVFYLVTRHYRQWERPQRKMATRIDPGNLDPPSIIH